MNMPELAELDHFNNNLKREAMLFAAAEREKIVGLGAEAVRLFLKFDRTKLRKIEATELPKGERVEFFVDISRSTAPSTEDGKSVKTAGIKLQDESGATLHIAIPVPDDYDKLTGSPEDLEPSYVIVSRTDADSTDVHRTYIDKDRTFRFAAGSDRPEGQWLETTDVDAFIAGLTLGVDARLAILGAVIEDMRNMSAVPQDIYTVGDYMSAA